MTKSTKWHVRPAILLVLSRCGSYIDIILDDIDKIMMMMMMMMMMILLLLYLCVLHVRPFGTFQVISSYPHCYWTSLLASLPVLNAYSFASN